MINLGAELRAVAEGERVHSFELFSLTLDMTWIRNALALTGSGTVRRRKLPAEFVIWLVIGMALLRDHSIDEVIRHLDLLLPSRTASGSPTEVSRSAVIQARTRLGSSPLETLFHETAALWSANSAFDRRLLADLARAAARARRLSWAKLLRRVLEVEPLACPTCPGKLRMVSFITDHAVVDHIIAHLRRTRPGLFPPARGSPTPTQTETTICRADADGFIYAQDFPPDEWPPQAAADPVYPQGLGSRLPHRPSCCSLAPADLRRARPHTLRSSARAHRPLVTHHSPHRVALPLVLRLVDTSGMRFEHPIHSLGSAPFSKGPARILATSKKLACTAWVADYLNAPPTSAWQLTIIAKTKQNAANEGGLTA